jgi:hypothetical protein
VVRDVILIRGAPGSGKSSVARALARHLPGGVTIEVDHVRRMIHGLQWEDDRLHLHAITAAAQTALAYIREGLFPVVLVDTLGFGRHQFALEALDGASTRTYSLVCRDPILSLRLLMRMGGYRDTRQARRFNAHIHGDAKRLPVIDTTWKRPAAVARHILRLEGLGA